MAQQTEAKAQQAAAAAEQARNAARAAESAEAQLAQQLAAQTSHIQVLATGWQEVRGPSGTYYCNTTTSESSWDKPLMAAPSLPEAEEAVRQATANHSAADARASSAVQAAQEAAGKAQQAAQEEARLAQSAHAAQSAGNAADQKAAQAAQAAAQARGVAEQARTAEGAAKEAQQRITAAPVEVMATGWQQVAKRGRTARERRKRSHAPTEESAEVACP